MSHTTTLDHMRLSIETNNPESGYPHWIRINRTNTRPAEQILMLRHDELGDLISALQRSQQYLRGHCTREQDLRELE